jgi:hypothetical protein
MVAVAGPETGAIEEHIMILPRLQAAWVLTAALLTPAAPGAFGKDEPPARPPAAITVKMEDCQASRPGKLAQAGLLRLLIFGPPKDLLVKRGALEVEGEKYDLYLPSAKSYATRNQAKAGSDDDTSTRISIDLDHDGQLTEEEGWYASRPIRIGDRMFEVQEIAEDGTRLVLKPSTAPLRGVIKGRKCPPFAFTTPEGEPVTRDRLGGKAFLLDIWSVT